MVDQPARVAKAQLIDEELSMCEVRTQQRGNRSADAGEAHVDPLVRETTERNKVWKCFPGRLKQDKARRKLFVAENRVGQVG